MSINYSDNMTSIIAPFWTPNVHEDGHGDEKKDVLDNEILARIKEKLATLKKSSESILYHCQRSVITHIISSMSEKICEYEQGAICKSALNEDITYYANLLSKHDACYEWKSTIEIIFFMASLLTLGTANLLSYSVNGRYTFFDQPTALLTQAKEIAETCDTLPSGYK